MYDGQHRRTNTEQKKTFNVNNTDCSLIWSRNLADSLDREYRKKLLGKIQRTAALRISSAYRTASEEAVLVISGTIPIDLLAKERYALQQQLGINKVSPNNLTNILTSNLQNWSYIGDYSERILRQKKIDLDEYHNTEKQ